MLDAVFEDADLRWERDALDRISIYAQYLNRMLETWEIDAILAVDPDPQ